MLLSDEEVRARIGKPTKGLLFVLLDGSLYHPVEGGWERYEDPE